MLFSRVTCSFLSLSSLHIFLNTLFSNIFNLCSSLRMGNQVKCQYKTTGKIIICAVPKKYNETFSVAWKLYSKMHYSNKAVLHGVI